MWPLKHNRAISLKRANLQVEAQKKAPIEALEKIVEVEAVNVINLH